MGQWVAPKHYEKWQPPKVNVWEIHSAYRKAKAEEAKKSKPAAPFPFVVGETAGPGSAWRPPEQKARPHGGKAGSIGSGRPPARPQGGKAAIGGAPSQTVVPMSQTVEQQRRNQEELGAMVREIRGQRRALPPGPERDARGNTIVDAVLVGQKALTQNEEPFGQMSLFNVPREREILNFQQSSADRTDRINTVPAGMQPGRQVKSFAARPYFPKGEDQGSLLQPRKYR